MKYIFFSFLLQLLLVIPSTQVSAGVAEASVGAEPTYAQTYDLSDMTVEEKEWFVTFLEGTFYADGWQQISSDILVKVSPEDRERRRTVLDELGYKIGSEWCKVNSTRKIDTSMLKKWGSLLKSTATEEPHLLAQVIENIDGEVNSLID